MSVITIDGMQFIIVCKDLGSDKQTEFENIVWSSVRKYLENESFRGN